MSGFSGESLALFRKLLSDVTLNVGAPDFEEWAQAVITAKRELAEAERDALPTLDLDDLQAVATDS